MTQLIKLILNSKDAKYLFNICGGTRRGEGKHHRKKESFAHVEKLRSGGDVEK